MRVVVTGCCGFIGSALTNRLLDDGVEVLGIDNLSRIGSEWSAKALANRPGFRLRRLDIASRERLMRLFEREGPFDAVFHLAGQVAVTTSYRDPAADFDANAAGSFHVVEAVRLHSPQAWCLYASTNKVYGALSTRKPVGANQAPAPCTPYGVSKYVGELYFEEYGRPEIGLTTCRLRQSCIYGPGQYGVEDQGWVAWFAIANLLGLPITIFGDGKQTRDLLFVDDLVELYIECWQSRLAGVGPVGGGRGNAIDLRRGLALTEEAAGKRFKRIRHKPTRPGDQPCFIADLAWIRQAGLRWRPKTPVKEGIEHLTDWIRANEEHVKALARRRR